MKNKKKVKKTSKSTKNGAACETDPTFVQESENFEFELLI